MQRSAIINVVGLTPGLIGKETPHISQFFEKQQSATIEPCFPALTCSAQATYLTGKTPSEHGIVGNGWYDRAYGEHRFWKQSNRLVRGEKLWDRLRRKDPDLVCANLFWWFNMHSSVDLSITPRPLYPADGRKVFDIHTQPMELREAIKSDLGDFPFPAFWGPTAGIASSEWIAKSAQWTEEKHHPSLSLVYLPHLDYDLQRYGNDLEKITPALQEIDTVVGELIKYYEERGVKVVLLSEYGISDVNQPVHLNRLFREKGWLEIKNELGFETIELGSSRVFALADHQIAHIYLNDLSIKSQVQKLLEDSPGVQMVLDEPEKTHLKINHPRCGDLVAIAERQVWFTYYYWLDDKKAPDFARCVDIYRKYGYDPVELFFAPAFEKAKWRVALKLAHKKMGLRGLMDVIDLDATKVRGSHGRPVQNHNERPLIIGDFPQLTQASEDKNSSAITAPQVFDLLYAHCSAGDGYPRKSLLK